MIQYVTGNLLRSNAEALVNTVNTVGVMGKGIALQFKEAFPQNYKAYRNACKTGALKPGKLLVFTEETPQGAVTIINFPTKTDWRSKSTYAFIEEGLKELRLQINLLGLKSVALPPLGCGNGGLDWAKVKPLIEQFLSDSETDIQVFEPDEAIKQLLQNEAAGSINKAVLTPARAMLLSCLFGYEALGEKVSLFSANKMAYLLQESGQPLQLKFVTGFYGPYSTGVEKVLYRLNGTYLKGLEQNQAKAFEPLELNYNLLSEVKRYSEINLGREEQLRLQNLRELIKGFESDFAIELLSSVHFLVKQQGLQTTEAVYTKLNNWSPRKAELFTLRHVEIAWNHLHKNLLRGN